METTQKKNKKNITSEELHLFEKHIYSLEERIRLANHEIRSPLNAIILLADLLKTRDEFSTKEKEYLNLLKNATYDIAHLLDNYLDLNPVEPQIIDVAHLTEDLCTIFIPVANKKNIELNHQKSKSLYLLAKPIEIKEIIYNILSNAIKYTPEGGKITVLTRQYRNKAIITIKDTGLGIPKEERKNVTKLNYRIQRDITTGGLGKGLYLVKDLVNKYNGKLFIAANDKAGTVIKVSLPCFCKKIFGLS